MIQLSNSRIQSKIVDFVVKNDVVSAGDIQKHLNDVTRPTLSRYLKELRESNILSTNGEGRTIKYMLSQPEIKAYPFDLSLYDIPYQTATSIRFNHELFKESTSLFTDGEIEKLEQANIQFATWSANSESIYKDLAFERCAIEFAWKSSKIEGNTYSLLETENLIKNKEEAVGKSHDDAVMILNQKKAFDSIYRENLFTDISSATLVDLHMLLMKELGVPTGIRKAHVGITGTQYTPLTIQSQLQEALDELFVLLQKISNPMEKAIIALASIAYIQPFAVGNKRTSRHFANLILHAHKLSPVVWRTVSEIEYKKAMVAFYELGNIRPIAEMWVKHYVETVETFFKVS